MAKHNLGLPYKGSKNTIAERIVKCFPSGKSFLDACCGGGAILEAAFLSGKFDSVTGYDIDSSIILLLDAVFHKFGSIDYERKQLVKYEDFVESNRRRETLDDAVNRFIASFGFNGYDYQWGVKRRELKYLMHQALTLPTLDERRGALRDFIGRLIDKGNVSDGLWSIKLSEMQNLHHIEQATNLCRLQRVESEMKQNSEHITTSLCVRTGSMFEDIDYAEYDVIYFDPPYANTKGYDKVKFDFGRFHELLGRLVADGKTVFVSEYSQPPGFTRVATFKKQMTQCATKSVQVDENLYFGGTIEEYEKISLPPTGDNSDHKSTLCDSPQNGMGSIEGGERGTAEENRTLDGGA